MEDESVWIGESLQSPPQYSLPFIGRQKALDEMVAVLKTTRLLTLLGPGGVGKTRLAVAFSERWPGTVRFVDLRSAKSHADVRQLVAQEIGAHLKNPITGRCWGDWSTRSGRVTRTSIRP